MAIILIPVIIWFSCIPICICQFCAVLISWPKWSAWFRTCHPFPVSFRGVEVTCSCPYGSACHLGDKETILCCRSNVHQITLHPIKISPCCIEQGWMPGQPRDANISIIMICSRMISFKRNYDLPIPGNRNGIGISKNQTSQHTLILRCGSCSF